MYLKVTFEDIRCLFRVLFERAPKGVEADLDLYPRSWEDSLLEVSPIYLEYLKESK